MPRRYSRGGIPPHVGGRIPVTHQKYARGWELAVTELNDWLLEGKEKWQLVEKHGEIVIPWNNPWYRCAVISVIGLAVLAVGHFWLDITVVRIAGLGIAGIAGAVALNYFAKGHRVGGIAAFVSNKGCSIGCGYDRLFIPWSAVLTEVDKLPINDQFMVIPIRSNAADELLIQYQDGSSVKWDGQRYKRAIIRAELATFQPPNKGVFIYADPNEVMVFFLLFLYPVMAYRASRSASEAAAADARAEHQEDA
jgi:hypothetical protein